MDIYSNNEHIVSAIKDLAKPTRDDFDSDEAYQEYLGYVRDILSGLIDYIEEKEDV
jgi:hypothetical protein